MGKGNAVTTELILSAARELQPTPLFTQTPKATKRVLRLLRTAPNKLEKCASGSSWRLATHSRVVTFSGRTYRALPKHDRIEIGHVRKMIRYLKINQECAKQILPI